MARWFFALTLAFGILSALPRTVSACPLCKEAISASNGEEGEDLTALPTAYNRSIYMMIGVPYLSLMLVGFLIYRGVKKNAAYLEQQRLAQMGGSL